LTFPYRLGKKRPIQDRRTLHLTEYVRRLPPPPDTLDVSQGISDWGMYANDRLGDCTCAAAGHMEMVWARQAGIVESFTDDQIVNLYNRVNGGHDDGAVELFVLQEWRKNGLTPATKIHAFAAVSLIDLTLVKQAAALFAGLYLGIALPITAQQQEVWDDTGSQTPEAQPGSWGGHAVNLVSYMASGLGIVTWGKVKPMTWKFWTRYVEEAWACIPEDFPGENLDFAKLDADLAQVGQLNP
jgi:hypothetical protein